MNELLPIVSAAGDAGMHNRAEAYNRNLQVLRTLKEDLLEAREWNQHGRFATRGFFSSETKPPMLTTKLTERLMQLSTELQEERAEIVRLSGGTVRP